MGILFHSPQPLSTPLHSQIFEAFFEYHYLQSSTILYTPITMAKTKDSKTSSKSKAEVKPTKAVKNASVTKPSQTPKAQSKAIAKETASKVNGKNNGAAKKEVDSSDSSSSDADSDSSDSSEDDDDFEADSDSSKSAAASDSDDSDSASDSDSEEESKPVAVAKDVAKKATTTGKAAVNGAAKAVAKATESDSADSDSSDSSEAESEEEAAPSKKRKAEDEPVAATKKTKTEETAEDTGSKNLFVGNLSWNVDDDWLLREFEEFGEISGARVISDKATGRSKGFGYVEFTSSASAALKAKKGSMIDGREANVDFSTPRSDAPPRDRAQSRAQAYGDSQNPPSDTLFLGNLSFDADENTVGEAF